jgi:transcriptional regulator with XRE-family HTH domain
MADLVGILARIDLVLSERDEKMSDSELARAATEGRSRDLIRNWRRAVAADKPMSSARLASLAAVANVLGVSEQWLATGEGDTSQMTDEERKLLSEFRLVPQNIREQTLEAALATIRLAAHEVLKAQKEDGDAPRPTNLEQGQ